jgi:phosphomannomutase
VIYPTLHAGRDALVGIALFLSHLAHAGGTVSALRASYPHYEMVKAKIDLDPEWDVDRLLSDFAEEVKELQPSTIDGVKLDLPEGWVHLRKSNTEPIVRVYAEAATHEAAQALVETYRERLLSCA